MDTEDEQLLQPPLLRRQSSFEGPARKHGSYSEEYTGCFIVLTLMATSVIFLETFGLYLLVAVIGLVMVVERRYPDQKLAQVPCRTQHEPMLTP